MTMFDLKKLIRPHLFTLAPYSSARDEFSGDASIYLDANENSYGSVASLLLNRYPDPHQIAVKEKISTIKGINKESIFMGVGSDEAIDLVFRVFCTPGIDNVIIMPPTYGMYEVSAHINDIEIKNVHLTEDFNLRPDSVLAAVDKNTKLIFVCTPNNPTGNDLNVETIIKLLDKFEGMVVVDEAYIDFSSNKSFIELLPKYKNLIVFQTFSKAWGMAALRLGMAFAAPEIISIFNKVKAPYNINELTQRTVLDALDRVNEKDRMVKEILVQRDALKKKLNDLEVVEKVYPTNANFILAKVTNAPGMYDHLVKSGIIVRSRHNVTLCENCLRITVGTDKENEVLVEKMKDYK